MENYEEKICSCALNRIFGFSPKTGLALMSHLGSASEVFRLKEDDLDRLLGPYSKYRGRIGQAAVDEAEKELERLERIDVSFIGWCEDNYPALLHECDDAPIGLYVRSTTPPGELWAPKRRIAVIGTRDISPYGRDWCARTVAGLAATAEKPVIVSGLAIGTDYYAHKAALEHGLPTIGVMATGPDTVYPPRHMEFAERLHRTRGCALITDYPPGTVPLAAHFLRRNRIIAGLSEATILIESKIKGGGMMTSRLAFSYNRDVYALPGRVDDIRSQGCNNLIRGKIAEPMTSVEELMEGLGMNGAPKGGARSVAERLQTVYGNSISPDMLRSMADVLKIISKERGITLDEISAAAGLPYHKVAHLASLMESDGLIAIDLLQRCRVIK